MIKQWAMIVGFGLTLSGVSLFAEEHAAAKADLAKGQAAAVTCAACHGGDGNSAIAINPSLAGQHPEYITKQLLNFKSGERNNAIMKGMVAMLATDEDMKNVAAYFAAQKPRPGIARDQALVDAGQKIYRGGSIEAGVPACAGCHSPSGAGIPAQYPRLAGQMKEYTLAQLKAFKAGERANDSAAMMRTIASRLSDKQIEALAEYVSGLQ
jgi:cytochrome c553